MDPTVNMKYIVFLSVSLFASCTNTSKVVVTNDSDSTVRDLTLTLSRSQYGPIDVGPGESIRHRFKITYESDMVMEYNLDGVTHKAGYGYVTSRMVNNLYMTITSEGVVYDE